jgi:hypothetical protein
MADLSRIEDMPARWRADEDFRQALASRDLARFHRKWKTPGWRLDHRLEMRRAIRYWRHYAEAVRSITQ